MIGLRYPTPLSIQDRALIDAVTHRYEGVEAPFIAFESDGYIELRASETIRMSATRLAQLREQANADKIAATAESPIRISNGAGAIDG